MTTEHITEGSLGLLAELDEKAKRAVERRARELRLSEGTTVFSQGDPGDSLYLVRSGLVDIIAEIPTGPERLVTLGPGETFGELAVVTGRPRNATAITQTGATLWRLEIADFMSLLTDAPQIAANLARILSERLQAATRARIGLPRGQTVVLWSDRPEPVADGARRLSDGADRMLGESPLVLATGPASIWDGTRLPQGCEIREPDAVATSAVMAVREHGLVLILCCPEVPRNLGGADRLVVLGDRPQIEDRGPAESPIRVLPARPSTDDLDALAREICGCRVGVVLGSGGIRGFAHAGVLKVLEEENIPIDVLGGASAGAIACALVLSGWKPTDLADLMKAVRETLGTGLPGLSLTPRALLTGRRIQTFLSKRIGEDTTFADLPKKLVVAATDLDAREPVHIDSGNVAEAVAASAAIPGVFPAVGWSGKRLVDGGISDPLPVRAVRERGADIVIAVNVMAIGKGHLGAYTPRFKIPLPGAVEALFVGLDTIVSRIAAQAGRLADVLVEPTGADAKWYQVVPARAYQHAGERAMQNAIPDVRRLLGKNGD